MSKFFPARLSKNRGIWIDDEYVTIHLSTNMGSSVEAKIKIEDIRLLNTAIKFRIYTILILSQLHFENTIRIFGVSSHYLGEIPIGSISFKNLYELLTTLKSQNSSISFDNDIEKFLSKNNTSFINNLTLKGFLQLFIAFIILLINITLLTSPLIALTFIN